MIVNDVEPRRIALRYSPPAIIIEYERFTTTKEQHVPQLYHHEIDLSAHFQSTKDYNINEMVQQITKEHSNILNNVSAKQIKRFLLKLAGGKPSIGLSAVTNSKAIDTKESVVLPQADYNRVSEIQLKQVKHKMDIVFQQNIVKPGDPGYEYDKQVKFTPAAGASDWDDD